MKKAVSILLSFLILLSVAAGLDLSAAADENDDFDSYHGVISAYNGTDENVVIPAVIDGYEVYAIQDGAFENCENLKSITIPYTVSVIYFNIALNCPNLEQIIVDERSEDFSSSDGVLFDKEKKILFQYPEGKRNPYYSIPDGVEYLINFSNCSYLKSVSVPASLSDYSSIAFLYLPELEEITVDESNPKFYSENGVMFDRETSKLVQYPRGKRDTEYTVPENITEIGDGAFCACEQLQKVIIPAEEYMRFDTFAFSECKNLTDIYIYSHDGRISTNGIVGEMAIHGYRDTYVQEYAEGEGIKFIPIDMYITVLRSELGTVRINGETVENESAVTEYGSIYTLEAVPNDSAEFVGWIENGKMVSSDPVYSSAAYRDAVYSPVFKEQNSNSFYIIFMDIYGNVIAMIDSYELKNMTELPKPPQYAGLVFNGWSESLDSIKKLKASTIVYADYINSTDGTFTVNAPNCTIDVNGTTFENAAYDVSYNSRVTVVPIEGTANIWNVNGSPAGYGASYSFLCGSDVEISFSADSVKEVPVVTAVSSTGTDSHKVHFLATRFVPSDYSLIESGFLYGKGMSEDNLVLDNIYMICGSDGGEVKYLMCRNTSPSGQFSLSYGVTSMNADACARAYMIYADKNGKTYVTYSDAMTYSY